MERNTIIHVNIRILEQIHISGFITEYLISSQTEQIMLWMMHKTFLARNIMKYNIGKVTLIVGLPFSETGALNQDELRYFMVQGGNYNIKYRKKI